MRPPTFCGVQVVAGCFGAMLWNESAPYGRTTRARVVYHERAPVRIRVRRTRGERLRALYDLVRRAK